MNIDHALMSADWLLYVMQPFESGRIGVKFVLRHGKYQPEIRIFEQTRSRKWVSKRVPHVGLTRRIRKARAWEANYQHTKALCEQVMRLFDLRNQMLQRLKNADLSFGNTLAARGDALKESAAYILNLRSALAAQFEGEMDMEEGDELGVE